MREYAKYKVVWNRKNETKEEALIQIEVLLPSGKQKWVGTGLYIPESEWDEKSRQIVNNAFATHLNKQISEKIDKIRSHELTLIDNGLLLTDKEVDIALDKKAVGSFINFMRASIDERNDIAPGTRYLHTRVANRLEEFKIIRFTDLTYQNIVMFDQKITAILHAQPSIAKQHQVVKTYISMATKSELMPYGSNPYLKFEFNKGKNKPRIILDDDEIELLLKQPVGITRDLAVFQLYTGLAHRDMGQLTEKDHIKWNGDDVWLQGLRKKSDEQYTGYLQPEIVEIIKRYRGGKTMLPCPDLFKYNRDLKILAAAAGIKKTLTSYVFRHTYATWMLRKEVPITTIQKTMGHSSIETTMIYAKLEENTIKEQMKRAFSKPREKQSHSQEPVQREKP